MRYTIRGVPPALDAALRERARREAKSLNQIVLEALHEALIANGRGVVRRSLDDVAGTWTRQAAVKEAIATQHRVDPDLWV